jgi:hypothetical protein
MPTTRPLALALTALLAACAGDDPTDTDGPVEEPTCPDGLPPVAFDAEAAGDFLGTPAGDFEVALLDDETFRLSSWWTGCDNLVIVNYVPGLEPSEQMWGSDASLLFATRDNVHVLFLSDELDEAARTSRLEATRSALLAAVPEGTDWSERLHFGVDRFSDVGGGLGTFVSGYNGWRLNPNNVADLGDRGRARAPVLTTVGITREQRWDGGGSPSDFVGGPSSWRLPASLGPYYDHLLATRHRAATDGATEVVLLDEEVTDRILDRTITLPDDLDAHDRLEVDVQVICESGNPFLCSEWDRIARISVCADGPACEERRELVRWITPYWRRGERRWIWDATPLLPLLSPGEVTFRIEMGPSWERATPRLARMALRLHRGEGERPVAVVPAFRGGTFDEAYNDREPVSFTMPDGATRAELVWMLSGHGQTAGDNCAEWCQHEHQFHIDGTNLPLIAPEPGIGGLDGCGGRTGDGVVPGQWGNWAPMRAYWCPGLPVDVSRLDITDQLTPGQSHSLTYEGLFRGGAPRGGTISLSSYVVFYE